MLTDTWLKNTKGKSFSKAFEKSDRDGLGVRVSVKGKVVFQSRYRFGGKPKRPSLGTYPFMTLKQARSLNVKLRELLEVGSDPEIYLQELKKPKEEGDTLAYWFMEWYEKDCKIKKNKPQVILRFFEMHILPSIGSLNIKDVSVTVWLSTLEEVSDNVPSVAEKIIANAKQMYKWLKRRKIVESNPLIEITAWGDLGIKRQTNYRSLNDRELKLVLESLEKNRMKLVNKIFTKLFIIYGCRPKELKKALPHHLDFESKVWTVPKENHKAGKTTGKPLIRPITEETEKLFNQALQISSNEFVFSGLNGNGRMSNSTSVNFAKTITLWVYKNRGVMLDYWSFYAIRKTARTNWSRFTAPHVAEIMLGHSLKGEWQTYDHYHYLDEQREALKIWCAHLDGLGMKI